MLYLFKKFFVIFNNFWKRECYFIPKSLASNCDGDGAGSQSVLELVCMQEQMTNERRDSSNQREQYANLQRLEPFDFEICKTVSK